MIVDTLVAVFAHAGEEATAAAEGGQEARLRGAQVLLAEDNEINQQIAVELLSGAGAEVTVASDGRRALEALQRMRRQPPDLILLDLMLPVMDGWEFAGHVRSMDGLSHIPIAIISAFERDPPDGVIEYLRKPIKPEALLRLVGRHCHRQ